MVGRSTLVTKFASIIIAFICSLSSLVAANTSTDILPGSILYASQPKVKWSSPSNTFSFRFLPSTTDKFNLAITYDDKIPIWQPNTTSSTPVVLSSNASFHFLPDGDLRLLDGHVLWKSNTANIGVSHATLDDSGNFILKKGSISVWTSFDHPTDTLVPSQNFTIDGVLKSGVYSFTLDSHGELVLKWNASIVYWNYGLNSSVSLNPNRTRLSLQSNGVLSLSGLNGPGDLVHSSDFGEGTDNFRFLKLDGDGNLRIYSYSSGSPATVRWTAVSDQCEVFGYCGSSGICSYNATSPICLCPSQNFELIDASDSRKGCTRKVALKDCPGNETMLVMNHTVLWTYYPENQTDSFTEGITACQSNCLQNPLCFASSVVADTSAQCDIKNREFISGYQTPALPSTSFVKVCKPVMPNPPAALEAGGKGTRKLQTWLVAIIVVLPTSLALLLLAVTLSWCCCRNNPKFGGVSAQYALLEYASGAPVQFTFKELHRATSGFKEKLGVGGFGAVYKGVLTDQNLAVAVKKLEGIEQGEKHFRMEVATISSTHHLNLVRLIGFCSEGRHRVLVYEYLKNRSLDNFLFAGQDGQSDKVLQWEQRYKIAVGAARGITYLHEECRDCIVHCDIKPENFLLDEHYNAKVSDFGLAKLLNRKEFHRYQSLNHVRGTRGYLAPEWLANLPVTSKSDVYSYGMVLLEIVSGRRNFEVSDETNKKIFYVWAYEEFEKGNVNQILDNKLANYEVDMEQVMRTIQVSFWCMQERPSMRPTMGKVVQMLEGIVEVKKPPAPRATATGDLMAEIGTGVINVSGTRISGSNLSATSAPYFSSASTFQTANVPSSFPEMKIDRPSSSFLEKRTRSDVFH